MVTFGLEKIAAYVDFGFVLILWPVVKMENFLSQLRVSFLIALDALPVYVHTHSGPKKIRELKIDLHGRQSGKPGRVIQIQPSVCSRTTRTSITSHPTHVRVQCRHACRLLCLLRFISFYCFGPWLVKFMVFIIFTAPCLSSRYFRCSSLC